MTDHNYAEDVAKYTKPVNTHAVAGILKHIGIAARSKDGSNVSCSDKKERDTVRDSFLKKNLGRKEADADLDKAVMDVCKRMDADTTKMRVTFYYLLAEKYGQLGTLANEAYAGDVRKYTKKKVDVKHVAGIVKHLGIALQSADASLVACGDKSERDRVRDSFLKTKLALTTTDSDLDKAVEETCKKMAADPTKSRVTFYYLLAEKYDKLSLFAA
jgi:Protein of unknown function (DUF2853)